MLNTQILTLETGIITALLLMAQPLCASEGILSIFRKSAPAVLQTLTPSSIPIILPIGAVTVLPSPPLDSEEIPMIYEDSRFLYFDDLPQEYDIWDESNINPYGVRLVGMTDTIKIDMRGYTPPSKHHITSNFGFRRGGFHSGIDIKVYRGDTVYCAFDGQVRLTNYQRRGYGNFVVVRHSNGLETLYAHLDKTFVSPGQTIASGEALGLGGNTGKSTGYHLHFETRYLGNVIDPNDLYDFNEHRVAKEVFWLSATNFEFVKEVEMVRFWTVRQGDTLGRISSRTGVSISRLCALNNIKSTSILRIGQKIRYT